MVAMISWPAPPQARDVGSWETLSSAAAADTQARVSFMVVREEEVRVRMQGGRERGAVRSETVRR